MEEDYLKFAKEIALYAGKVMMEYYNKDSINLNFKEDKTAVTIVDKKINSYLIEKVKIEYKNHSVRGEEESYNNDSDYVWVCDPLDGTGMYVTHIPVFVFSLALVYRGEPIIGVVYNPNEDKMYSAIKGKGAYCNDKKISVNSKHLADLGYKTNIEIFKNNIIDEISLLRELKETSKISSIGSSVLSFTFTSISEKYVFIECSFPFSSRTVVPNGWYIVGYHTSSSDWLILLSVV